MARLRGAGRAYHRETVKMTLPRINESATRADIANRQDIETVVRRFYEQAIPDPVIGKFFTKVAKLDLEAHLPIIANFWEQMLLQHPVYSGSPMHVHLLLNSKEPMLPEHFARWLALWEMTVDQLFAGEKASMAKARAQMVAKSFSLGIASVAR
jgi:hemoglobin